MLPIVRYAFTALLLTSAAGLAAQDAPAAEAPASAPTAAPTAAASTSGETSVTEPAQATGETATGEAPASEAAPATPVEEPKPAPKLVATQLVLDLGKAQKGDRLAADFVLENAGDATLKIKSVQPACGCTVASFDAEIAPGAKGEIHAQVDTSALHGGIAKSITVLSNDPLNPRVVLTIKAQVLAFIEVSPSYARIVQVQSQPQQTASLNLWSEDGAPIEVKSVAAGESWIVATAHRATADELRRDGPPEQWRLDVTLRDDAPLGPITDQLVVVTTHPKQPKLEIPLSGFVRPVLSPTPAVADFGKLDKIAQDKQRVVFKLFNFGSDPVELTGSSIDLPFVVVTTTPEEAGRRFRVELRIAPDAPKGKFEGTLKLETTSPVLPTVEVPVRGRIG